MEWYRRKRFWNYWVKSIVRYGDFMKKGIFVALACVIILGLLAAAGVMIYQKIAEKYTESEVKQELKDYYNVPDGKALLIFDETIYDDNKKYALFKDGEPYLDLEIVKEMYTTLLTWSSVEKKMYYTTASQEYIITPESTVMSVDGKEVTTTVPSVILEGDKPYIAMSFLLNCSNISYKVFEDPARVLVTYSPDEFLCATVKAESSIRVSQDIKADYLEKLKPGSVVRIIEGGGIQQKGFIKVMSEDGVRGYILQEKLDWDNRYNQTPAFTGYTPEEYKHNLLQDKIFLIWHLVYSKGCIDEMLEYLDKNPEVNTVAPTWFFMSGKEGDIVSYADKEYVDAAHKRKVKVWAVLKNDNDEKFGFNGEEDTHVVLSNYEYRQNLIKNIVNAIKKCGADGINVDIETHKIESGVYFIQFLRELYLKCSTYGISISVDNLIPEDYNSFYNMPEQVNLADYLILMAYDEHYFGSEAGSVSSLSWFKRGVDLALTKCPKEQLIVALPFYTRRWKESNGKTTSLEWSLITQDNYIKSLEVEPEWLEDAGQYYYEYTEDGAVYKLWAEEKKSLTLKSVYLNEKEVSGAAAWMLGFDTDGLWNLIKRGTEGDVVSLTEDTNDDEEPEDGETDADPDVIGP